jgi:hypothetical protein
MSNCQFRSVQKMKLFLVHVQILHSPILFARDDNEFVPDWYHPLILYPSDSPQKNIHQIFLSAKKPITMRGYNFMPIRLFPCSCA